MKFYISGELESFISGEEKGVNFIIVERKHGENLVFFMFFPV